jgi:hypothetical protein
VDCPAAAAAAAAALLLLLGQSVVQWLHVLRQRLDGCDAASPVQTLAQGIEGMFSSTSGGGGWDAAVCSPVRTNQGGMMLNQTSLASGGSAAVLGCRLHRYCNSVFRQ